MMATSSAVAPDLSIVIVNFNSARFVPRLLESIATQEWSVDDRPGRAEIIIVDNASRGDDAAVLKGLESDAVKVILNVTNTGYGQANNQGYHVARGTYHMVLNPDAMLLPGCLDELVGHLARHPESAMVSPMAFMDPTAQVLMPPNQVPTPELHDLQTRAQVDVEAFLENLTERTRYSYEYWTSEEPLELGMLSGSCLVFRRGLFEDEYPFDPGFPLYYEDTDMFLRLTKAKKKMVFLSRAKFLHFWSQSAETHVRGANFRCRLSEQRYYEKHFGGEGLQRYEENRAKALETHERGLHIVPLDFKEVEGGTAPPVFTLDRDPSEYFIEMAGNPIFTLAAGFFPREGGGFTVSQLMWDQLGSGRYYLRAIERKSLETLAAWTVVKP